MGPFVRGFALAATLVTIVACSMMNPSKPARPARAADMATECEKMVPPLETEFPANFDFPQNGTKIKNWLIPGMGGRTRLHAYCVFAGLQQDAPNFPVWRMWKTASQALPLQYNTWRHLESLKPAQPGAEEASQPLTINESRAQASGKLGAIRNLGPIYGVHDEIVKNPFYQKCLMPIPKLKDSDKQLYKLKDGQRFQSNGDIMIATVSYSPPAYDYIVKNRLYNAETLDPQLPAQPQSPPNTNFASMPDNSIVLKAMYWPVAGGSGDLTALPIWDWNANPPGSSSDGQYAGYEMKQFWRRAVAIAPFPVEPKRSTAAVVFLHGVLDAKGDKLGPNLYGAPIVGIDRFYSLSSRGLDALGLSDCDRALLDASAYWTYNRRFMPGDSLALIAMHIMTKEQPSWTFQSAFWHPDALKCHNSDKSGIQNRLCSHQPDLVPGGDTTWKNYMMVTTYGATQQEDKTINPNIYRPASTVGPVWPVAYNPYIELAATHPITTNCINCHSRAAWPPDNPKQKPHDGRFSAYLQDSPANPNVLETFTTSTGPFKGLLMLDNMWAVSDRAGYPATESQGAHPTQ